jgi:hypothetical protein
MLVSQSSDVEIRIQLSQLLRRCLLKAFFFFLGGDEMLQDSVFQSEVSSSHEQLELKNPLLIVLSFPLQIMVLA